MCDVDTVPHSAILHFLKNQLGNNEMTLMSVGFESMI